MQKTKIKAFNSVKEYTEWDTNNCAKCIRGININNGVIEFRCRTQEALYEQNVGITDETTTRSIVLTSKPVCDGLRLKKNQTIKKN